MGLGLTSDWMKLQVDETGLNWMKLDETPKFAIIHVNKRIDVRACCLYSATEDEMKETLLNALLK